MSSVTFLIGKTLGKYEVLEHIGHGGMSEVYKGQQAQLHRLVAIKVMHPFLADDEGFVVRFQREARIVATLRHPNIVQVYDFDYNEELALYYMVMEFIDGPTLKDRLLAGALSLEETVAIGAAIADALDYAHRHGMVHRDIKPANIMFIENQQPVLTDFGIARMVTLSGLTASGAMVGTPAYMAPEIGKGKAGSALSDIYSLSVLLYQAATGSLPFSAESPMGMVLEHVNTPPPSPTQINPEIPGPLAAAILRGLEKEPEARFATAGEMAAALRASLGAAAPAVVPVQAGVGAGAALGQTPPPVGITPPGTPLVDARAASTPPLSVEAQPEEDPLDQARLVKSWNPLSHRRLTADGTVIRSEDAPVRSPWLLTGSLLSVALLAILWGIWLAISGGSPSAAGERTLTDTVSAVMRRTPAPTATVPTRTPTATAAPAVSAPPSPTPTTDCSLRVRQDSVRIEPAAVVAPGTALTTRISVHNSGNCPWPSNAGLVRTSGAALGAPEVLSVIALPPGETIQWILPMLAPEEAGVYTSTWEMQQESGARFGSRILVAITVADITPMPPTPTLEIDLTTATPEPLALADLALLTWQDDPNRGTWSGTAQILASGGSGQYRYFLQQILPANELVDGRLAVEGRRCEPVALDLVVLSGGDVLAWQGEIAYPAPDRCR